MTLRSTLAPYVDAICLAGYVLGALAVLEILPASLPVAEANTKYVYVATLAFISYVYWTLHPHRSASVGYVSHLPARTLTNPRHAEAILKQRGPLPAVRAPPPPQTTTAEANRPSDRTFEAFNR